MHNSRQKFSPELQLSIVRQYERGKISLHSLARKYHTNSYAIRNILLAHGVEIRQSLGTVKIGRDKIIVNGKEMDKEKYIEQETAKIRSRWSKADFRERAGNKSGVPGRVEVATQVLESPETIRGRMGV